MLIDLDGFKGINDNFGHSAGDAVLSSVGEILRRVCRGAAGICRFGGDEFLVASKAGREQIHSMAEFLVQEIGGTPFLEGQAEHMVTVSIGAATSFGEHSGDELMQEVDRNMYAAKNQGKNRGVASESFLLEAEKAGEDPQVVDWVARYGGEELCAVMPDTSLQEAVAVAERIRRRIEDGRVSAYDGRIVSLTASLGAGVLIPEDADIVDFVQRVGDKTREAKASGRNAVRY
jgi:diguanylate cyclase (GGDEF)-like protein